MESAGYWERNWVGVEWLTDWPADWPVWGRRRVMGYEIGDGFGD